MNRIFHGLQAGIMLGIGLVLTGCGEPGAGNTDRDNSISDAERVVVNYIDAYNSQDLTAMEQTLADTFVFNGNDVSFDDFAEFLIEFWQVFPDYHLEITHQLNFVDHVTLRLMMSGTGRGEYHGHDIDGKDTEVSEVVFFRVRDGRIDEYWYDWDSLRFWTQLGVIEDPISSAN